MALFALRRAVPGTGEHPRVVGEPGSGAIDEPPETGGSRARSDARDFRGRADLPLLRPPRPLCDPLLVDAGVVALRHAPLGEGPRPRGRGVFPLSIPGPEDGRASGPRG